MEIKTNHQWRDFAYRWDVPVPILADQFDHLSTDDVVGFFKYRGYWYHLSDFMTADHIPGFNGYHADSFFSAVVINLSDDCEQYQVGLALN